MILVLGATGSIGRHLVHTLRDTHGADVTAFVRDPVTGAQLGCPVVLGDLDDPASVAAALAGVDRLFLNAGPAVPVGAGAEQPMVRQQRTAIDAAAAAGVSHVVKLSVWHARRGGLLAEGAHGAVEQHLRDSGVGWSILQPGGFMQNFSTGTGAFQEGGDLLGAYRDGRVSYVDCQDIAASAAALLTGDPRPGETFVLTGPQALDHNEIAAKLSTVAGRRIRYLDLAPAAFADRLTALGLPAWFAADVTSLFSGVAKGVLAPVSTGVADLTGRAPRTFDEFLHAEADAIRATWQARPPRASQPVDGAADRVR